MSFRVSAGGFEGPFDLLLQLVMRQKVDIGAVSISSIADQYLAEMERISGFDLEVASDFLLIASTLLELKAAALLPTGDENDEDLDDYDDLTPDEIRSLLVERLIVYRKFRSAASELRVRGDVERRMHPRTTGPTGEGIDATPDYLSGVSLPLIAQTCARLLGKRELFLLESEHIAAKRIPLERRVEQVDDIVRERGRLTFEELVDDDPSIEGRVVSLLALLELHKRNALSLTQTETFGPILIERKSESSEDSLIMEQDPEDLIPTASHRQEESHR